MDASVAYVGKVLQAYFDPSKPPEVKAELEAGLSQFKGRDDGWRLAMHVLQGESRGDAHDPYLLWFSATLLQEAINKSWPAIPEEAKAGLRQGLLQFMLKDGGSGRLPPFAANKLAAVCANMARLDWPERYPSFLQHLEAGLGSPETRPGALLILSVAVEQFEAVAPDAPSREPGAVLWSRAEELQHLLEPVYPGLLGALASALQAEAEAGARGICQEASNSGPTTLLAAIAKVLGGSKGSHSAVLKRAASGPGTESLLSALFQFATPRVQDLHPETPVAVAALGCLGILADAALPPSALGPLVGALLRHLAALVEEAQRIQVEKSHGRGAGLEGRSAWWLAVSRLLSTLIHRHAAAMLFDSSLSAHRPMLESVLGQMAALTFVVHGSSVHAMVSCEVWRALAEALSARQDLCWEAPDPDAAMAAWEAALSSGIRDGLVGIADDLMSGMVGFGDGRSAAARSRCPSVAQMDASLGSGAELQEAMAAVSISDRALASADSGAGDGYDGGEDADGDDEGGEDEEGDRSEAEAFADACEGLVGQLVGLFPLQMVPRVLVLLSERIASLEQNLGCAQPNAVGTVRDLCMALRLASRCACHLPAQGQGAAEAAAAVTSVLGLVEAWPGARLRLAAATGGDLAGVDRLGARLFKLTAALEAVWLPKAVMQTGGREVAGRAWAAALRGAASVASEAIAQGQGQQQLPPAILESAFEMVAVLGSVSRSFQELGATQPPEEQLQTLVQAAPVLLLRQLPPAPAEPLPLRRFLRAGRGLYAALTDMLLRQSSAAEAPGALLARSQAVLGPLVTILENALSGETPAEVVVQVCAVLSSVAGGLKTASKAVRDTLYQGSFVRTVGACVMVSRRCQEVMVSTTDPGEAASLPAAKMAEALQRLAAAVVDAFSGEMGASGVEDLLKCTIQIYSMEGQDGVDGWGLFCNGARAGALLQVLYQCSTARCCSKLQILATLGFLFALWDQIMEGFSSSSDHAQRRGEGRGMKDLGADLGAVAAQVLRTTTDIIRENWGGFISKGLAGSSQGNKAAAAAAMAGMAARHSSAAASAFEAPALAASEQREAAGLEKMSGPAAALRLLDMTSDFVGGAAVQSSMMPSLQDMQLVLGALLDLEDQVQMSQAAELRAAFPKLLDCFVQLLSTARFSSIEADIVEMLYVLASADWQSFMAYLPTRISQIPAVHYAGDQQQQQQRATVLLQPFSQQSSTEDPQGFTRSMKRFLNDVKYFQNQRMVIQ